MKSAVLPFDGAATMRLPKTQNILVRQKTEILAYLKRHRSLGKLIPRICEAVRQAFGAGAELALELYADPESGDRYPTLYVRL